MSTFTSYSPNYYSIVDIIATQETVPCVLQTPLPGLGFLVPGNDNPDIAQNTLMEWPFWLASHLAEKRNLLKIQIPKTYSEKSREIFEADAKVVNLQRINPYFYEFGRHLACLNQREASLVKSLIIQAFRERFRVILDWSDGMVETQKTQMLDVSERALLQQAQRACKNLNEWLIKGASCLQPAEMVSNFNKRKLIELC